MQTLRASGPLVLDAFTGGKALTLVQELIGAFKPDLVISDAEVFTHRAAARSGIPRIGFDHFGILAHCRVEAPAGRALHLAGAAATYRLLMGQPDRVLVSSFFQAEPRRPGVTVIPTLLRPEVLAATPGAGEHLLVYLNRARHQLTGRLEGVLQALDVPSIVYGAKREGVQGRITFRRTDRQRFVDDLAGCRALVSTAGNQLVGEAAYLGKPLLVMPEDSTEQHVNAKQVERLGLGRWVPPRALDLDTLRRFLADGGAPSLAGRWAGRDGTAAAVEAIEAFAAELGQAGGSRRAA